MDILSLEKHDGYYKVEVRLTPSDRFYPWQLKFNVILHLRAKYETRKFTSGNEADLIPNVSSFSGACKSFSYNLDRVRQSINTYIMKNRASEP